MMVVDRGSRAAGAPRPPRLGEWILSRTLPAGVVGESIKGDLEQEFRLLRPSSRPAALRAWYLAEAL